MNGFSRGLAGLALSLAAGVALAHPHFNKTVTATIGSNVEVAITYNTTPANEAHAGTAKVGEFVTPRRPVLKLSAELKSEKTTLPAGEYTIGVIKNADRDWTLALYPGRLQRGDTPDSARAIRLDSMFSTDHGTSPHMLIDITPGEGRLEGKAVLTLHFGSLFLAGVLA
ncbi:MAG TPA: hypothetical protein VGB87_19980 [Vicinamibacteria bacterium]